MKSQGLCSAGICNGGFGCQHDKPLEKKNYLKAIEQGVKEARKFEMKDSWVKKLSRLCEILKINDGQREELQYFIYLILGEWKAKGYGFGYERGLEMAGLIKGGKK